MPTTILHHFIRPMPYSRLTLTITSIYRCRQLFNIISFVQCPTPGWHLPSRLCWQLFYIISFGRCPTPGWHLPSRLLNIIWILWFHVLLGKPLLYNRRARLCCRPTLHRWCWLQDFYEFLSELYGYYYILCTGNNYVTKEMFSLTMLRWTIKVFNIYIYLCGRTSTTRKEFPKSLAATRLKPDGSVKWTHDEAFVLIWFQFDDLVLCWSCFSLLTADPEAP